MGIKVAKFGGTSLADAGMIRKAQQIIEADPDRRFVVPSAPGKRSPDDKKITDLLYLCHANASQGMHFDEAFDTIAGRYIEIVKDLGVEIDLQPHLDEIRTNVAGGASADYTASRGEYLNGLIMAALLGYDFVDAAEVIFFNEKGRFDAQRTQEVISKRLAGHKQAVVPGFYGSMPDGTVKTFSRGGSDITGAIVARGVGAEVYENWTDVSGLLMADPRIVPGARPMEVVTYSELRELSYMGASVLHDEAVFPVRQAGIPVNIRNTNHPDDPGTRIVQDASPVTEKGMITGIAGKKDFTVIAVERTLMNQEIGFARRLLSVLEVNGVSFEHLPSGIDSVSVVIADSQINAKLDKILAEIRTECQPDAVHVQTGLALIATVGRGMAYTPGISARIFGALGKACINIRMIDQGSSEINVIAGVANEDFEQAVRAIYNAFVEAQ